MSIATTIFGDRSASSGRSIDPVHPRDPVFSRLLGIGRRTTSGIQVTEDKALAIPTVLRGTSIIANTVKRLPREVYRKMATGDEPDMNHFARRFIRRKFNDELQAGDAIKLMQTWAILRGNAVAWIHRDGAGRPTDIVPLLPDRVGIYRISKNGTETSVNNSGRLMYWTKADGKMFSILPENVLHIKGFGTNPFWGMDIVEMFKETLGGDIATREHGHRYFGQGATNAGFVTIPKGLPPEAEERLIRSLRNATEGLGKAHKYVILEEGQNVMPSTISNHDSQFLESKKFNVGDLANMIRIQAEKVGDRNQKSYNSLESARADHKDDDIVPWVNDWEEEFNEKLLTTEEYETETHCICLDESKLEWVPFKERVEAAVQLHLNNLASKDEARGKVNFPPCKDNDGEQYLRPLNHVPTNEENPDDVEMMSDGSSRITVNQTSKKESSGGASKRELTSVEALQKAYLAVDVILTSDEARELVNKETDAGLIIPGPEFKSKPANSQAETEPETEDSADEPKEEGTPESSIQQELTKYSIAQVSKRLHSVATRKAAKSEGDFVSWLDGLDVNQGPEVLGGIITPKVTELKSQLNQMISTAKSGDDLKPSIETIFSTVFSE